MKTLTNLALLCTAVLCVSAGKPKEREIDVTSFVRYVKRPHGDPKYEGPIMEALVSMGQSTDGIKILSIYEKNEGFRSSYKLTYTAKNGDRCFMKWSVLAVLRTPHETPGQPTCKSKDSSRRAVHKKLGKKEGPTNEKHEGPAKKKKKGPKKGKKKGLAKKKETGHKKGKKKGTGPKKGKKKERGLKKGKKKKTGPKKGKKKNGKKHNKEQQKSGPHNQ